MCFLVACSSGGSKSRAQIESPQQIEDLTRAKADSENRLGMVYKGDAIRVSFKVGTARHPAGWWGERKTIGGVTGILGGVTYRNTMTLYTDPKTGNAAYCPMVHEMMRAVMYSNGMKDEASQNAKLKAIKWGWCR